MEPTQGQGVPAGHRLLHRGVQKQGLHNLCLFAGGLVAVLTCDDDDDDDDDLRVCL